MCKAVIELVSPGGVPISLSVSADDETAEIVKVLERADSIGGWAAGKGWAFQSTEPVGPSVDELASGPMFGPYPCSISVSEAGFPTWILADGRQAHRKEKQGDTWYSYKDERGQYHQVVSIPKGEKAPRVRGI